MSPLPFPYRTVSCPFYTVPYRTVPYHVSTVPCPFRTLPHRVRTVFRFFTVPFFTASATFTVPFFSLTARSAKRTEPLILTVRFLVFDREPNRTKMGTVIRLLLRTATVRYSTDTVRYSNDTVRYDTDTVAMKNSDPLL